MLPQKAQTWIFLPIVLPSLVEGFIISFYLGVDCHGADWGGTRLSYNWTTGCGQCFRITPDAQSAIVIPEQEDVGYALIFYSTLNCSSSSSSSSSGGSYGGRRLGDMHTIWTAGVNECVELGTAGDEVFSLAVCADSSVVGAGSEATSTEMPGASYLPSLVETYIAR
ncbi:hypothetical protein BX600DRAFT_504596 [Xylariales sp. PMI_506]|nr:hypothetical protein BX600DRAFT_504596 [Xylariales sp. PMI_506]